MLQARDVGTSSHPQARFIRAGSGLTTDFAIQPDAAAVDSAHAAISLDGVTNTLVTAAITNPDVERATQISVTDANGSITAGTARIRGANRFGRNVVDNITLVGAGAHLGVVPMISMESIEVIGCTGGGVGDQFTVGYTNAIGIPIEIAAAANVLRSFVDGVADAGTTSVANRTYTPASACDGTKEYELTIRSSVTSSS